MRGDVQTIGGMLRAAALLASTFAFFACPALAESLTAQPGDDITAIVASMQDGDELSLAPGSYIGGIFIDGRTLTILGPMDGEAIIAAPVGTNVLIGVLNGGSGRFERLTFAPTDAAPFALYVQGASASCDDCRFANTPSTPIYVEAGTLSVTGSRIDAVAGDAVVATAGSTLTVTDTTFSAISGTAIVAAEAASATLSGLTIESGDGILLTGGTAPSRIAQTDIAAAGQFGVQAQTTAPLTITGTRAQSADTAIVAILDAGGALTIDDTTAIGVNTALHVETSAPLAAGPVAIDRNVLLSTGGGSTTALQFLGARNVVVGGNTIVSGGQVGVLLADSSSAFFDDNLIAAAEMAVATTEEAPGTGKLENDVLLAPTALSLGGLFPGPGTTRIALALAADAVASDALRADVATLLQPATLADAATLERVADAVQSLRDRAAELSTVRLLVTDAAGREAPSGFVVLKEDGTLAADSPSGEIAPLEPGTYRLAAGAEAGLTAEVTLAAGDAKDVRLSLPRSLWVPLARKTEASPSEILFIALPEEQLRSLAQNNGYDWRLEIVRAFPRPEATDAEIDAALELARDAVRRLHELPTANPDGLWGPTAPLRFEARRIIAAFGTADDAHLLLDTAWGALGDITTATFAAAYLEARLGLLAEGVVHDAMQSADPEAAFTAAAALHLLGAAEGTAHLLSTLDDPAYADWRHQILYLLRGVDNAAIAAAYRQQLVEFIEAREAGDEAAYFPSDAFAYLLAFSVDSNDWPLLGLALAFVDSESNRPVSAVLARHAADPTAFTDVLASFVTEHDVDPQVYLCAPLRVRGARQFHRLNQQMQDQISGWWLSTSPDASVLYSSYVQYYLEASGCWPNADIAKYFYGGEGELKNAYLGLSWMPEPWHEQELLDSAVAGTISDNYKELLGFVAPDRLAAALGGSAAPEPALQLAYRSVVSRLNYDPLVHSYEDGIERRPFVVRNLDTENYSGAMSGMVLVDPQLGTDGRLVIRLRIDQVPYYNGYCDLAATISTNCQLAAWKNHAFTLDQGKALIKSIRLSRDREEVPLTITGPHALGLMIDAGPSPRGYAGLVLTVELELIDDSRTLVFDLFASARARGLGDQPDP